MRTVIIYTTKPTATRQYLCFLQFGLLPPWWHFQQLCTHKPSLGLGGGAKLTGQRAAPEMATEKNLPQWEINPSCLHKSNIGSIICYHEKFYQTSAYMSYKGTVTNMASHGQRNNELWTTDIWPGHYSRDHCHTAKLSNCRESTNQDPSASPASQHSRGDKHTGIIKPQHMKSNIKICTLLI